MITKNAVYHILGEQPMAYHPVLAKTFGGIEAGIFLSKLLVWHKTDGEWIARTQAELEAETGLSRRNQETARRKLREAGVLEDRLVGVPATVHYRLDLEAIAAALNAYYGLDDSGSPAPAPDCPVPPAAVNEQTRLAEPGNPDCLNRSNQIGRTEQTSLAEPSNPDCTDRTNWIGRTVQSSLSPEDPATRSNSTENVQFGRNVQTHIKNDLNDLHSLRGKNEDQMISCATKRRTKSTEPVWVIPAVLDTEAFQAAWAEWEEYRKAKGKRMSQLAGNRLLKRLADWGPERAVDAIGFSIANDYQGIWEDSARRNGRTAASTTVLPSPMPMNIDLSQYNLDGVL